MYITNIKDINDKNLYKCDKKQALYLEYNGFPVLSISEDIYYFYKTEDLMNFINLKGGEN